VALAMSAPDLDDLRFRHPLETDYSRVVEVVDEWWGGRKMRALLPRLWFQHFSGTSWLLEAQDGRLAGFIVAFISQDDPTTGYVHMIAADPNWRRSGIGRALYERGFADLAARGARQVKAITWPGNRSSVAFHTALGFRIDDGPGTQRLYGISAYPDYDGWGEDRVAFTKDL
jgi:ribosomal protein S18 acetylase RimI-like enzyme